jgi:DNA-binding response OmpR family regulator
MASKGLMNTPVKGRVLFLDADADTRELLNLALAEEGYEIVVGSTVAEGLRLARSQSFDLILLDWYFRDGTGLEMCEAIRRFDTCTPVFFYTGMADNLHIRHALRVGAQGCLIKPVSMDILLKTVAACVEPSKMVASEPRVEVPA